MTEKIREGTRRARKPHWCSMCNHGIGRGDLHYVSTYAYDGSVYDWRTCLPCRRDQIANLVWNWRDQPDEGVGYDDAKDWAYGHEWMRNPAERAAARRWLARAAGGEGE